MYLSYKNIAGDFINIRISIVVKMIKSVIRVLCVRGDVRRNSKVLECVDCPSQRRCHIRCSIKGNIFVVYYLGGVKIHEKLFIIETYITYMFVIHV